MDQKLILIVDDDDDLREILSIKLKNSGFRVDQVSSGLDAIQKAKEVKPDLVLLDVKMPIMNGIQTLKKFKADPDLAALKVIFLTNLGEAQEENAWLDEKFAQEVGAVGHIRKTDDLEKIIERIKKEIS